MNKCNSCCEIVKLTFTIKKCDGCKRFCAFNTVLFKQKLLHLVL